MYDIVKKLIRQIYYMSIQTMRKENSSRETKKTIYFDVNGFQYIFNIWPNKCPNPPVTSLVSAHEYIFTN